MILIIAVLAILLFIACIGLYVLNEGVKESHKVATDYQDQWLAELKAKQEVIEQLTSTASELVRIKDSFKALTDESDVEGFGTHIKWHNVQRATANTYRLVFDLDIRGREIIEDLVIRFKRNAFVSDQNGGERETSRRLGRQEVIDFILNRCNTATDPRYSEELELLEQQQND